MPASETLANRLPLFLLVGLGLFVTLRLVIPAAGQLSHGFIGRYTAAQLLARGVFGPQLYDDAWFAAQVQAVTGQPIGEIFTPNLPTLGLLTLPLVGLSPQEARASWLWLSLGWFVVSLLLLWLALPQKTGPGRWALLIAGLAAVPALGANFEVGQVYTLLLFLFALALLGQTRHLAWLTGSALGLAFVFKTSGLLFWLLLICYKRWRALGWTIGTVLLLTLISLPWIGLDTWLAYPSAVLSFSSRPALSVTAYQTTGSFLTHLFQYDPVWNPTPLLHWPALGRFLTLAITIVAVGVTLWLSRDAATLPVSFAAFTLLNVILLPVAEEYHFVLLIIPMVILVSRLNWRAPGPEDLADTLLLGLALMLLAAPLPYKEPALLEGWPVIVAYPRLAAGWLLWLVAVGRLARGGVSR